MKPSTVASPCSCVARSTSGSRHPGPTWASLASGSTVTSRMPDMSSVRPPSAIDVPAMLCPPPLTLSSRPWSRAKPTAAATSRADMRLEDERRGRRPTMAFQISTASSQPCVAGAQQPALDPAGQVVERLPCTATGPPDRPPSSIVAAVMAGPARGRAGRRRVSGRPGTRRAAPSAGRRRRRRSRAAASRSGRRPPRRPRSGAWRSCRPQIRVVGTAIRASSAARDRRQRELAA